MGLNMQTEAARDNQKINTYLDLKVVPTYQCGKKCKYCYNKHIYNTYNENPSFLIESLSRIIQNSEKNIVVEIIGGEPLSRHGYEITNKILDSIMVIKKENIKLVLQTGSSNLNKIQSLTKKIDGLSYSIDISLSPKIKNLNRLGEITNYCKDNNVPIQIQTILNENDTIHDINNFINLCCSQGIKWLGMCYPDFQVYNLKTLDKQATIYFELIRESNQFKDISIGGMPIQCAIDFFEGCGYEQSCYCGEKCLTIQPDGRISPCLFLRPDEYMSIESFVDIKHKREKILHEGICADCEMWNVCHGGCMIHSKFLTGNVNSRDETHCYLLKKIIDMVRTSHNDV